MSRGGICDHLAGGFHRYSVDERWVVPHFEKMSYDNSELLRNYTHAFQSFAEPECARVAREIMRWVDTTLSDREQGGFYSSQDADESLDDDGDYWTWTRTEAAAALTPQEMAVAGPFYDIGELGDMHHNPEKNTLHVDHGLDAVARMAGCTADEARERLVSAQARLYAARLQRKAPYVDRTIYTGWNGMMISAYLEAGRVLGLPEAVAFGLKSLDRLLTAAWNDETLGHVVAYGEGSAASNVAGNLEDYVFAAHAALDAWETTGQMRYFAAAQGIAASAIDLFYDADKGGFFDTGHPAPGESRMGALSARRKPLQDAPTPAGNPVVASLLLRLESLTGEATLRDKAQKTLECFAGVVEHLGLYAASYGQALRRMLAEPTQIVVCGTDRLADQMERVALGRYMVGKSVIRLRAPEPLPPALAETIPHLPGAGTVALICRGHVCSPAVSTLDELIEALGAP